MANTRRTYTINVQADVSDLIKKIMEAQKKLGDMGENVSIGEGIDFDGMKKEFERALKAMQADLEKLKVDHIEFGKINTNPLDDLFERFEKINTQIKNINNSWSKVGFDAKVQDMTSVLNSFKDAAMELQKVFADFGVSVGTVNTGTNVMPKKFSSETQNLANLYKQYKRISDLEGSKKYKPSSDIDKLKSEANAVYAAYDEASDSLTQLDYKLETVSKGTSEYNDLILQQASALEKAYTEADKLTKILDEIADQGHGSWKFDSGSTVDDYLEELMDYTSDYCKAAISGRDKLAKEIQRKGYKPDDLLDQISNQSKPTAIKNRASNQKISLPVELELNKESLDIPNKIREILQQAQKIVEEGKIDLDLRIKKDSQAETDIKSIATKTVTEMNLYNNIEGIYKKLYKKNSKTVQDVFGMNPEAIQQLMSTIASKMGEMSAPAAQSMQEIVDSINRVITALEKLSDVTRTAFNLPSDAELNNQWTDIESSFKKIVDKKGNIDLRKNKSAVNEILTSYAKYTKNGGAHSLSELTSNASTLKKLTDAYKKIDIIDNQEIQKDNDSILQLKTSLEQLSNVLTQFDVSSKAFEAAAKSIADNLKQIVETNQQFIEQNKNIKTKNAGKDYEGEIDLQKQKTKDTKSVLTHEDKMKANEHARKMELKAQEETYKKEQMMLHDHNIEMMHENTRAHQEKMARQKFQNEIALQDNDKKNKIELAAEKSKLSYERQEKKRIAKEYQKHSSEYYAIKGLTKADAKNYDFSNSHQGVQDRVASILTTISSLKTRGNKLAKINVEDITGVDLAELQSITKQLIQYRAELHKLQEVENKKIDADLLHERDRKEKIEDEVRKSTQKEATSTKDKYYKAKEKYLAAEGKYSDKDKNSVFNLASDDTQNKATAIKSIIADLKKEAQSILSIDLELITADDIAKLNSYSTRIEALTGDLKTLNTAATKEVKNIQEKLFPEQTELYDISSKLLEESLGRVNLDGQTDKVQQEIGDVRTWFSLIKDEVLEITKKDINLISDQDIKDLSFYTGELNQLRQTVKTLFPSEIKNTYGENVSSLVKGFQKKRVEPLHELMDSIDPREKTDGFNSRMEQYKAQIIEIEQKINAIRNKDLELIDENDEAEIVKLINSYEDLFDLITKFNKNKQYNRFDPVKGTVVSEGSKTYKEAFNEVQRLAEARGKLVKGIQITQTTPDVAKFTATVKTQTGEVQKLSYAWDGVSGNIRQAVTIMKQGQSGMAAFTGAIKDGFVRFGKYFTGDRIISSAIRAFRTGISEIKELDSAFTEMQKVSDATTLALREFSEESFNIGKSIGATGLAIQQSSADWMRLGYSLQEAGDLAKNTALYSNVGDMDIDTATEHLISSVKAFKDEFNSEVEASGAIVDKFNEIGNNFAISSADIGSSFERSAAALVAGGNNIDEALGLTTAGNLIIQDADTVGNALKVVALRVRGAKTELEEMGEETEGMAESTSKLRNELKALTGVDIMKSDGKTFKSTYQIFDEISKVFDKLSDVSQANVLEKLAGKTRSSVVAGLLKNFDTAREVVENAQNAEGSALEENQKYMQSIEGHTDLLKNKWQEVWASSINRETITFFLDLTRGVLELVDALGAIPTALGAMSFFGLAKGGGRGKLLPLILILPKYKICHRSV